MKYKDISQSSDRALALKLQQALLDNDQLPYLDVNISSEEVVDDWKPPEWRKTGGHKMKLEDFGPSEWIDEFALLFQPSTTRVLIGHQEEPTHYQLKPLKYLVEQDPNRLIIELMLISLKFKIEDELPNVWAESGRVSDVDRHVIDIALEKDNDDRKADSELRIEWLNRAWEIRQVGGIIEYSDGSLDMPMRNSPDKGRRFKTRPELLKFLEDRYERNAK